MAIVAGTPNNDLLYGTEAPDQIAGAAGDDKLFGFAGDDILDGDDGSDLMDGGGGADTMSGGPGNDFYYVDDAGDRVVEAASAGSDLVFAAIDYTLPDNVERVAALDPRSTAPLRFTGNALANEMIGNDGANTFVGGSGDLMRGEKGDDTYIVTSSAVGFGESDNGGFDTVRFGGTTSTNALHNDFDYSLGSYQVKVVPVLNAVNHIEKLEILDATMTNSVNLRGSLQDDIITGNAGVNVIEGHRGNDTMSGFGGDDYYFVGETGDAVIEAPGEGYDTVFLGRYYASVTVAAATITSYTLPDDVERVACSSVAGKVAYAITGNGLDNELSGNDGTNTLNGKEGHDILIGYQGADTFLFDSALTVANADSIADFTPGIDKIALDNSVFSGLQAGTLSADAFTVGTQAQDAADRIIYDAANGDLYFDADGTGSGAEAVFFAHLYQDLSNLSAGDFAVVDSAAASAEASGGQGLAAEAETLAGLDLSDILASGVVDRIVDAFAPAPTATPAPLGQADLAAILAMPIEAHHDFGAAGFGSVFIEAHDAAQLAAALAA